MIALLKEHSLTVKSWFEAERFALTLSERQSTASITVGPDAPTIGVNDWLMDDQDPGKGIVWRVKSVDTDYATETRTIQCEHLITALRDLIMFGETTPGDMAGNAKAKECTAKQAVQYILKQQSDWTLGSFGYSKSAPYNFNGDDLLSALETVSSSLMDAWWSYDFASYPFKLNIKKKNTAVSCEMRMDRNIRTLRKTIDRTRMYTRFYPIGKNNLKLGGKGYVSKNEKLYGVVCKVETDQNKDTTEKLQAWAEERLNNHAEPIVTVTISGLDLSAATGETLDRLRLGTVCQVPLPEFSTTITEIISKLSWSDKLADPESVSITLANQVEDVASIINNLVKGGGGGGRAAAKNAEEDHAWFVDTTEKVGMVAEAVAGKGADKDWSRVSEIYADGTGINARVTKTEKDVVTMSTEIKATEDGLKSTVKKGHIISEINQTAEAVTISANKINLKGLVQALNLGAYNINAGNITGDIITGQSLVSEGDVSGDTGTFPTLTVDDVFDFDGHEGNWKTAQIPDLTYSEQRYFTYVAAGETYRVLGYIITAKSTTTIHYLGY